MQNNQQENQSQMNLNEEESYVNLTSEQQLPRQQQNPNSQLIVNRENPPIRQSLRVKYQHLKFANQQYQNFRKQSIQKAVMCPITLQPMDDPVIASSGRTFQRKEIINWFRIKGKTCPCTRKPITQKFIENYAIKNLCQEYEELLKKLNDVQALLRRQKNKNRITINQYQRECGLLIIDKKKRLLDHSYKLVQMPKFVRVNWTFFHQINLNQCEIDDDAIQMFLERGNDLFKNVEELNIENNKITTLKKLQRLPMLKRLYVGGNKEFTQDTLDDLEHINESECFINAKRKMKVYFKIQPL